MNKDIIYIDVEDDVTSVIGKIRASNEKIVALVPPKTNGALQSAVNLRLLQKAADNAGKRIVLITNNSGLSALAAGVKIPVAKNLQSKPEIPSTAATDEAAEDDVIKGDELPVGELAAAAAGAEVSGAAVGDSVSLASAGAPAPADDDLTIDDSNLPDLDAAVEEGAAVSAVKGPKVPNFSRFRKWIFIGGGLIVAIILFFVLMNIFGTGANVVIAAQTSSEPIDLSLTLSGTGQTNPNTDTIQSTVKSTKKTESVTFTPTGSQNNGSKATGSVKYSNSSASAASIPAGTQLSTSDGAVFTTDAAVTVPAATLAFSCSNYICPGTANGTITASAGGTKYNGESGSLSGTPSGVSATLTADTSGGTDNVVTVVTDADIAKAEAQLTTNSGDAASAKSTLTSQFGSDYVVIGDSFASSAGTPTSSPASGQAATTAKLSVDTTYTLTALAKSQIKTLTLNYLSTQTTSSQKVYDDGSDTATVGQYTSSPGGVQSVEVKATGKVGPNIDPSALKSQLVGEKTEQIIQQIEAVNGVKNVTVSFSPFWRTTAPSADKINVSFDLSGNG